MKLKKLKEFKQTSDILFDSSLDFKETLCNNYTKRNKADQRSLLKKIESSRLIYNRKERLVIALKRAFVLANKFEDTLDFANKVRLDREILIQAYMEEYRQVSNYPIKKLDRLIVDKNRLTTFNLCRWSIETIDIKDLGVWPSFGEIDQFTTCGNLVDTKNKIMDLIKKTHNFARPIMPYLPEKTLSRLVLEEKHANLIFRFYPIIVTAKGLNTRRIKANKWAKKKLGFGIKITPYDIEDGNHRATALALFGIKKIKCFVGRGLVTDSPK